jgi:predicted HTH transcriptional regulator
MEKKMTKREMFTLLKGIVAAQKVTDGDVAVAEALIKGLDNELELLNRKRNSTTDSKSKTQVENIALKADIGIMLMDGGMTATNIAKELDKTVQKASALLRQMVEDGKVERAKDGKSTVFVLVESEDEDAE